MPPLADATRAESAGHPFLVFVNTVKDDGKTRELDAFDTVEDLAALMRDAGLEGDVASAAATHPLAAILALREQSFAVLSAMAAGRQPGREEALHIETAIKAAVQDSGMQFSAEGLSFTAGPLGGLHDRLVLAFVDLMQRPDLDRLRECRRCTHLFLDHGRGQGRRWCSMARCGNRAKAEAFRKRHGTLRG